MGTPVFKFVFDRHGRASKNIEGSVELSLWPIKIVK